MYSLKKTKTLLLFMTLTFLLTACESEYGKNIAQLQSSKGSTSKEATGEEPVLIPEQNTPVPYVSGDTQYYFKTSENYLCTYNGTDFDELYMKGVNLGLGKPGYFPGETAVTEEEYARWFRQIGEMNANCIRVYTVQPPDFYKAFYEYNLTAEEPLYLFQGTWYDETRLLESGDAFDRQLTEILEQDMRNLVDLIHGDCVIEPEPGKASGTYTWDISPYVIGWILGIESDAAFVSATNWMHEGTTSYEGTYIRAGQATPFEVFWAQTGDYIISYEMDRYHLQRPLSYSNWPTADMLEHPSETMEQECSITLNVENLQATDRFPSGLFASYHIYPYYPNFMYTQKEYISYKDTDGSINTYKAYLEDLKKQHTMPVLVAEFGVPASRGVTHINPYTGFNQGSHTEEEQGEMLAGMMQDIYDTGYAGGIVFTWQDEWFKRTWNTEEYSNPNRRAYWYDVMTCEQHFGLLDFVPGDGKPTVVLDGSDSEWNEEDILLVSDTASLSVKHDCAYLYLMIKSEHADFDSQKAVISFDITPNSGSDTFGDLVFERPADFVIILDGTEFSQMLVHSYYDLYQYEYDKYDKGITTTEEMKQPDNNLFQPVTLFLERELVLPDRNEVLPVQKFNAGALRFGISDYDSDSYDSLADYYYKGNILELRIPWLMLNFRDPSTKEIEDDFRTNGEFSGMNADSIWLGLSINGAEKRNGMEKIEMHPYQWENWDQFPYFERLRKGYYILQEQFKILD